MHDARTVLDQWFNAIEAKDVEKISELLADDVSIETEILRKPMTGRAAMRELLGRSMSSYDSIRIDPRKIVSAGRDAAALVAVHVRFSGDIDMLGERLSTAGREFDVMTAIFIELNEAGQIARVMRVRDTWSIADQLGLSAGRVRDLMRKFEAYGRDSQFRAA